MERAQNRKIPGKHVKRPKTWARLVKNGDPIQVSSKELQNRRWPKIVEMLKQVLRPYAWIVNGNDGILFLTR